MYLFDKSYMNYVLLVQIIYGEWILLNLKFTLYPYELLRVITMHM